MIIVPFLAEEKIEIAEFLRVSSNILEVEEIWQAAKDQSVDNRVHKNLGIQVHKSFLKKIKIKINHYWLTLFVLCAFVAFFLLQKLLPLEICTLFATLDLQLTFEALMLPFP